MTQVECTATDASGNASSLTFSVTVRGAAEQLHTLALMDQDWAYPSYLWNMPGALTKASELVGAGKPARACAYVRWYMNAFKDHGLGYELTQRLILEAGQRVRAVLGCVPSVLPYSKPTIVMTPACSVHQADFGVGPYGGGFTLEGFPSGATVDFTMIVYGLATVTWSGIIDASGSYGPWYGSFVNPLGITTLDASVAGKVLATGIVKPC